MVSKEDTAKSIALRPAFGIPGWLSFSLAQADRLHCRFRRRTLRTFPFSRLRAHNYRKRLKAFARSVRESGLTREIWSAAESTGALMLDQRDTSLLFGTDVIALCENARAILDAHQNFFLENESAIFLGSEKLVAVCPEYFRLGLAPAILDLAEACLGLDCLYLGATLKRERADGRVVGTRRWHLDIEDERVFRILVYLSPVAPDGGPFEYFPRETSRIIKARLNYRTGPVGEAQMAAVAPEALMRRAVGVAGEAIVFDSAGIFHRNQVPLGRDRYSITFAYCSRQPLELRSPARLPAPLHRRFLSTLSLRERRAIPPPRFF